MSKKEVGNLVQPGRRQPEPTCEHRQSKVRRQEEKKAYYRRNPHLKWNEHG